MSQGLTPEQIQAMSMLASGQTIQAVADSLGISRRTIERWNHSATFIEAVRQAQAKAVEGVVEATAENIRDRISAIVPSAVNLLEIMIQDDKANPNHRLRAVDILGNWAGLKQATVLKSDTQPEENLKGYLEYLKRKPNGNCNGTSQH